MGWSGDGVSRGAPAEGLVAMGRARGERQIGTGRADPACRGGGHVAG